MERSLSSAARAVCRSGGCCAPSRRKGFLKAGGLFPLSSSADSKTTAKGWVWKEQSPRCGAQEPTRKDEKMADHKPGVMLLLCHRIWDSSGRLPLPALPCKPSKSPSIPSDTRAHPRAGWEERSHHLDPSGSLSKNLPGVSITCAHPSCSKRARPGSQGAQLQLIILHIVLVGSEH